MQKVVDKPVQVSDKRTRHSFRLYHDPSNVETGTKDKALYDLLNEFVNLPSLFQCGPAYPEKMVIYHDGDRWIVAAESESETA